MTEKTKKTIETALSAIWWAVLIALVVVISAVFIAKAKGQVPRLFGYSVMRITTSSMEDAIPQGSYILIKKTDPKDIEKDDVICFYSQDPSIYGFPNTHRVIEEPVFDGEKYVYHTMGDNNLIPDAVPASSDMLIGKYVKTLNGLTALSEATKSPSMMVVIIVIQVLIVGGIVAVTVIKKRSLSEQEQVTDGKGKED